jgi:hypothetical protein
MKNQDKYHRKARMQALLLLVKRILLGSLIILFIGMCSFAFLFITMYFI